MRKVVFPFYYRQWHLLSMIARCGTPAIDLIRSNPALAWALASYWVFHKVAVASNKMRVIRRLLKNGIKQTEILAWLGFPPTKSARKILMKIPHKGINCESLLMLRKLLKNDYAHKILSHLPIITDEVVNIMINPHLLPLVNFSLLNEIALCKNYYDLHDIGFYLFDSWNICNILQLNEGKIKFLKTITQVKEFHDSLVEQLNRAKQKGLNVPLPPPPLPGNDCIVPLTKSLDLIKEGREQKNCVASYIPLVARKMIYKYYIYKTIPPLERCTLSLVKKNGKWRIEQLKMACNQPASKHTLLAVKKWLEENQGNKPHFSDKRMIIFG